MILAVVHLPWPDRPLWPNGSKGAHWSTTHRARVRQKRDAAKAGQSAGLHLIRGRIPEGARIAVTWQTHQPPRTRSFDDDGLIGAMKAARDQIAASLGVDDSRFVTQPVEVGPRKPGGAVICTLAILDILEAAE